MVVVLLVLLVLLVRPVLLGLAQPEPLVPVGLVQLVHLAQQGWPVPVKVAQQEPRALLVRRERPVLKALARPLARQPLQSLLLLVR